MARQGLSQEQIFTAAQTLLDRGQNVTVSAIRDTLGSGSYSTISTHLAKWREANDNTKPADIPSIPETVVQSMGQVWAVAWKEAQALIKAERDGLELARRDMEREKQDMDVEITRLEAENNVQGGQIESIESLLAEKEKALNAALASENQLKIDNARLDERVKLLESRAGELKEELGKLHSRLQEATAKTKVTSRTKKKSGDD